MRRGRVIIFIAVFALLALVGSYFFLQSQPNAAGEAVAPTPILVDIVVAQQNIPQGTVITEDVLGKISLPEGSNFDVMFRYEQRIDQLVGKVAKYPIEPGVVITQTMVGSADDIAVSAPEWAGLIPPSMTAISIPVSRLSSVSYGVGNGAHVNVISCFLFIDTDAGFQTKLPNGIVSVASSGYPIEAPNVTATVGVSGEGGPVQGRVELDPTLQQPIYVVGSEEQRPRPVCQTIFQNITVLRLGNFPLESGEVAASAALDAEDAPPAQTANTTVGAPDVVTLIVSPQDATALTYMLYGGAEITLTLRRTDDTSRVDTEAATLQFLLSQYAIPVPAKLPYAPAERIDSLQPPALINGQ